MNIEIFKVAEFKKLNPVKREVLKDEKAVVDRNSKLKRGLIYKKYNIQINMLIITNEGEKWIRSLIYNFNRNKIMIKGKVELPIACIKEVKYLF